MGKSSEALSNKERLELILQGKAPDIPPHFELVFQLAKEMFGMDAEAVEQRPYGSEKEREEALLRYHVDMQLRLAEEFGYAAVQPAYGLRGITELNKAR